MHLDMVTHPHEDFAVGGQGHTANILREGELGLFTAVGFKGGHAPSRRKPQKPAGTEGDALGAFVGAADGADLLKVHERGIGLAQAVKIVAAGGRAG